MRIVIDARELRTSSGKYVNKLLEYLQKIDTKNDYFILLKPKDLDDWKPSNKRFNKVACPHKEFTFAEQMGLLKQVYSLKPNLVHFTFAQQPLLYLGPTITTIHDLTTLRFGNPAKNKLVFNIKRFVYSKLVIIVARKSKHIITPTNYVKEDVAKYARINSRKITVTPESADKIDKPAKEFEKLKYQRFVLYVGRPNPHKNIRRLMQAFDSLRQSQPDVKLVLAGKTDRNYKILKRYAKRKKIENVVFTGFIPDEELVWLYQNCSAYVFPSLSEGFGLPGLEAMTYGAPVVSSNATCLPEVYGDAALYFDPENIEEMAAAIQKVLNSPKTRQKLVDEGYKQVKKYSWRTMAEQTKKIYESALGGF